MGSHVNLKRSKIGKRNEVINYLGTLMMHWQKGGEGVILAGFESEKKIYVVNTDLSLVLLLCSKPVQRGHDGVRALT